MQDAHRSLLGDRRPIHHHSHHREEAMKCPRCDSLNTKFCYYNNYNLSQPRHFCKNCRRYWTNGGVLRNVPVGGGSRKSKRSKPKPKPKHRFSDNNQNTQNDETPLVPEIGGFVGYSEQNPGSDGLGSNGSSATETTSFGEFLRTEDQMQGLAGGILDQTVRIDDRLQNTGSNDGFETLDWQSNNQNGLDLFNLDDQRYWSQATTTSCHHLLQQQWCDSIDKNTSSNDNLSLFLP